MALDTWLPVYNTLAQLLEAAGQPLDRGQFRDGAYSLLFTNLRLVLDEAVEAGTALSALEPDGPLHAVTENNSEYNHLMSRRYRVSPELFKAVLDHFTEAEAATTVDPVPEVGETREAPKTPVRGLREAHRVLKVGRDALRRKILSLPPHRQPVKSGKAWWWESADACRAWWTEIHRVQAPTPRKARARRVDQGEERQWEEM